MKPFLISCFSFSPCGEYLLTFPSLFFIIFRDLILGATVILKYLISVITKIIFALFIDISVFQWGIVAKVFYLLCGWYRGKVIGFPIKMEIFSPSLFNFLLKLIKYRLGINVCDITEFCMHLWATQVLRYCNRFSVYKRRRNTK